jgi:nucleoside-diphosphate-sugar epimerase
MRIFLTGATGQVGSAALDALLRGRHHVTALVRTPQKAEHISQGSATAIVGDLSVPPTYAAAVEESDAIVHCAMETGKTATQVDRLAIDVFVDAARQRARAGLSTVLVYTSGVWVLGDTTAPAAEDAPLHPPALVAWRPEHEQLVLAAADATLRTVVVRPGIVYGGPRGIVGDLLKAALNGLVRVVGEGSNHWPCVYDRDLADLYLRLVNDRTASGLFHANDEADETVTEIVDAIAGHSRNPADVRHVPLKEARAKLGAYADALALDQIVRSPRARAIGWTPSLRSVAGNVARLLEEVRAAREAA